jgi:CheY-like chemotaxis protein
MKQRNEAKPFEILLVEDNPADVRLTMEALKESSRNIKLHVIENGLEALHFLRKKKNYSESPIPDLIFLDLNSPKKNG